MRILINCSNLQVGGALQVAQSLVCDLRNHPQNTYVILCSDAVEQLLSGYDFGSNFTLIRYNKRPSLSGKNKELDQIVSKHNVSSVLTVFGPSYWNPKVPHICGYARPHYIYKNSPFFSLLGKKEKAKLYLKEKLQLYHFKRANVLVTENADVSNKLGELIPGKEIVTITNYFNQVFENKELWSNSVCLPEFDGITLLTIAAPYAHKNFKVIPAVIKVIKKEYPDLKFRFAVSLDDDFWGEDIPDEVKAHIINFGKVNINECPWLYEQSDFLFLPTLLECFSASYPEAMFMGKPIITSDLDFARGLCGNAALYVDPLSPKEIADNILKLVKEPDLRRKLIAEGKRQLDKFDHYATRTKKYLEIMAHNNNSLSIK